MQIDASHTVHSMLIPVYIFCLERQTGRLETAIDAISSSRQLVATYLCC